MKTFLFTSFAVIILNCGCSDNNKNTKLTYKNDLESQYWAPSFSTVLYAGSHSGNFACKIDRQNPFSQTFNIKAGEVSKQHLKKVVITAWFLLTSNDSEQNLVLDVRDSASQNTIEWININASEYVKDLNEWGQVRLVVDLTKKNRNNPSNNYRIYASNGKEPPVYVDDFEISFE